MPLDDSQIDEFLDLPELRKGDLVDSKYRVLGWLGEGAFGRVYEARDTRIDRLVALKTVYRAAQGDHARRLRREIALIKEIEHANIVRLYDSGEDDHGLLYMAMEFVDGETLGAVIEREAPFNQGRMLRVAFQILDALAGALDHGVVHLDLKPENVLLTAEGLRTDVVKLLDFGIAKTYEGTSQFGYAAATMAAGTPLYMAPEQVRNRDLGPHTDVYTLALILVEILTGEPVFAGEDAIALLTERVALEVELPPGLVDPGVAAVLERALRTDHRERFPHVVAMFEALQESLGHFWGTRAVYGPTAARHVQRPVDAGIASSNQAVADFFADADASPPGRGEAGAESAAPPERMAGPRRPASGSAPPPQRAAGPRRPATPSHVEPREKQPRRPATPSHVEPREKQPRRPATPSHVEPREKQPRRPATPSHVEPREKQPRRPATPSHVEPREKQPRRPSTPSRGAPTDDRARKRVRHTMTMTDAELAAVSETLDIVTDVDDEPPAPAPGAGGAGDDEPAVPVPSGSGVRKRGRTRRRKRRHKPHVRPVTRFDAMATAAGLTAPNERSPQEDQTPRDDQPPRIDRGDAASGHERPATSSSEPFPEPNTTPTAPSVSRPGTEVTTPLPREGNARDVSDEPPPVSILRRRRRKSRHDD